MTLLAMGLALLGIATLVIYAVAFPLHGLPSTAHESVLATIGLAYGGLALWCGRLLWRLDGAAPQVFIAWCLSLVFFNSAIIFDSPELHTPWLIPVVAFAVGVLAALYFYIRRQCAPAA